MQWTAKSDHIEITRNVFSLGSEKGQNHDQRTLRDISEVDVGPKIIQGHPVLKEPNKGDLYREGDG